MWQKTYGGPSSEWASSVQYIPGKGIIVAGVTESFGAGETDLWVLQLDTEGNALWQKAYGGIGHDGSSDSVFIFAEENNFILASQTGSFGYNDWDLWILKLDSSGEIAWQKAYGSIHAETLKDIKKTSDMGFIITSDHTPGSYSGIDSIWILKLNEIGEISWERMFYGGDEDRPNSILQTTSLDFLVSGETGSFDSNGNFCSNCGSKGLLVKLDKSGSFLRLPICFGF